MNMGNVEDSGSNGADFAFVESPHSKARAIRALRKEQSAREQAENVAAQPINRVKILPAPPVAPVLPSFDDIMSQPRASTESGVDEGSAAGVRRKPSVVKKLRDRMTK